MVLPPEVLELIDSLRCEIQALRAENAELRRELQAVDEFDKEPWADALRATLLDANEAVQ